jgi:hypothetical protein
VRRHELLLENARKGNMTAVAIELADHGQDIWRHFPVPKQPTP